MSGEHQLERSVLEGKERDELHAIADALGVKPGSRTKKADLVDKILQATGVTAETNGSSDNGNGSSNGDAPAEKPKRTRATKKTAEAPEAPAAEAPAAEAAPAPDASSDEATTAAPPRRTGFAARAAALAAETAKDPAASVTTVDIPTPDELVATEPEPVKTGFAGKPRDPNRDGDGATRNREGGNEGGGGGGGGGNRERNNNRDRDRDRNQNRDRNQGGGNQNDGKRNRRRRGRDRFDGLGGGGQERDMPGYNDQEAWDGETQPVAGLLDLADAGFGLIRSVPELYLTLAMFGPEMEDLVTALVSEALRYGVSLPVELAAMAEPPSARG